VQCVVIIPLEVRLQVRQQSEACEIISFVSNNECEFVAIFSYVNNK